MNTTISEVQSKSELKKFINSQWNFYTEDRNWVPPLKFERQKLLNTAKNPFFQHSRIKHFLAERDGKVVGRISALVNDEHNKTHNDKVGFFGFFECENNQETANALFGAAGEWLLKQGMDTMRGPANPSLNDECGLLVDGFDSPPVVLMTYNPPYYQVLVEGAGFEKAKDLYAYKLDNEDYRSEKLSRLHKAVTERYGINIRRMDFKNKAKFLEDKNILKSIYNKAWEKNWGFVKMTDAEFDALAADLKSIADPDYTLIAEINGEAVGFALGLPDINQTLIHNRSGSLIPGVIHLLTKKKKIDMLRIIVLGVIPEYRNKGIDAVLYHEIGARSKPKGIRYGEASWILEDNEAMIKAATQVMHGKHYKTYRMYDKSL